MSTFFSYVCSHPSKFFREVSVLLPLPPYTYFVGIIDFALVELTYGSTLRDYSFEFWRS